MEEMPKKSAKRARAKTKLPAKATKAVSLSPQKTKITAEALLISARQLKQQVQKMSARQGEDKVPVRQRLTKKASELIKGFHSLEIKTKSKTTKATEDLLVNARTVDQTVAESPASLEIPDIIQIPSAASERLIAKTKALSLWYKERFPQYAARTAHTAGFIFIAVAGAVLAAEAAPHFSNWGDLQQAAVCATLPCTLSVIPSTDWYTITEPDGTSTISNMFNVVTALAVLTLGLILVILGLVLRRESPNVIIKPPLIQ